MSSLIHWDGPMGQEILNYISRTFPPFTTGIIVNVKLAHLLLFLCNLCPNLINVVEKTCNPFAGLQRWVSMLALTCWTSCLSERRGLSGRSNCLVCSSLSNPTSGRWDIIKYKLLLYSWFQEKEKNPLYFGRKRNIMQVYHTQILWDFSVLYMHVSYGNFGNNTFQNFIPMQTPAHTHTHTSWEKRVERIGTCVENDWWWEWLKMLYLFSVTIWYTIPGLLLCLA